MGTLVQFSVHGYSGGLCLPFSAFFVHGQTSRVHSLGLEFRALFLGLES